MKKLLLVLTFFTVCNTIAFGQSALLCDIDEQYRQEMLEVLEADHDSSHIAASAEYWQAVQNSNPCCWVFLNPAFVDFFSLEATSTETCPVGSGVWFLLFVGAGYITLRGRSKI